MRYKAIDSKLFIENRKKFVENMKPNSVAVFSASDIMPTSADGTMGFKQNSDLFWLCGVDQEETILLIAPDSNIKKHREVLFLKETNENIAIWEGAKLNKKQAFSVSGIPTVYWNDELLPLLKELVFNSDNIYLNGNEHLRNSSPVQTREQRMLQMIKDNFPLHNLERTAPILHKLRAIKSQIEIDIMQVAMDITEKAFRRIGQFVKPGVWEHEIEAELFHEFKRNRSRGPAYDPIIASGFNACVLHYIQNDQQCKDGDILLLDIGAEYGNYAADLTRCLPVNGKFSPRQKEIYQAVKFVKDEATKLLVTGNNWIEYHEEVGKIMEKELLRLKLITESEVKDQNPENPAYKKYFPHGTSHYLGLDVHDVGSKFRDFEPGMVFTVEPGIYIREESLGVRLEDDILITEDGNHNLMGSIPIEIEEIEDLMAGK
jgi:Xaa-Pro aminopeptidase